MSRADPTAGLNALGAAQLPAEVLAPALLEALHDVVPSLRNLLDWTDEHGHLKRYFFEGPIDAEVARHYFDEFHNRREREAMPAFGELQRMPMGVLGAAQLNRPEFFASALYQDIWRPQGLRYRIEAVLRGSGGRLLGSLVLYRGPGERCFTTDDEAKLASVLPIVAHLLEGCADATTPPLWVPAPEATQTLLMTPDGKVAHATPGARSLLMLTQGGATRERLEQPLEMLAATSLRRVLQGLHAPLATGLDVGTGGPTAPVDSRVLGATHGARHHVHHGALTLEAVAMQQQSATPLLPGNRWVAVTLRRNEPHSVALERALRGLPLTPAQRKVCRALYHGASQPFIAQDLGVAVTTVVDHVRKLYRSLQVRSVLELRALVDALIHQGKTPPVLAHAC